MNQPLVVIFTRVYRNDAYITRCFDSVVNQSYPNWIYYLLVSEETKPVVERYAKRDSRVKWVMGDPSNAEQGFVTSIKDILLLQPDYIVTLDADDWLSPQCLQDMVSFAEKNALDIAACGTTFIRDGVKLTERKLKEDLIFTQEVLPRYFSTIYAFFRPTWGKLFRTQVIQGMDLQRITPAEDRGAYGGDTMVSIEALRQAKRIGILHRCLHFYQMSENSGSYMISKGRLDADEIQFHFTYQFLSDYGVVSQSNLHFLFLIHGNALLDSIRLILKQKYPLKKQYQDILYLLKKKTTQEMFSHLQNDTENTDPPIAKECYALIFDKGLAGEKINQEIEKILFEIFCQLFGENAISELAFHFFVTKRDLLDDMVFKPRNLLCQKLLDLLSDDLLCQQYPIAEILSEVTDIPLVKKYGGAFLLLYPSVFQAIIEGQPGDALNRLCELLSKQNIPKSEGSFKLLIDLAALVGNEQWFITGQLLLLDDLLSKGRIQEGAVAFQELQKMGVEGEAMDGFRQTLIQHGVLKKS